MCIYWSFFCSSKWCFFLGTWCQAAYFSCNIFSFNARAIHYTSSTLFELRVGCLYYKEECCFQDQILFLDLYWNKCFCTCPFIQIKKYHKGKQVFRYIHQRGAPVLFQFYFCGSLFLMINRNTILLPKTVNYPLHYHFSYSQATYSPCLFIAVPSEEECISLRGSSGCWYQSQESHILWSHVERNEEFYRPRGDR